ncbi:MAG TPA: glutamyl-tRNA reductase [Actinomycetota bacterium]|nr:glutamyl-tRNA reductase [Actinomycetota bacterium]
MPLLALGVSYRRASLDLLERLTLGEDRLAKAYRWLADDEEIAEAVLVSTCNRVELYGEVGSYHTGFLAMKRFLGNASEVPVEELAQSLYAHYEDSAAEHLFRVTAGLDSMVLGESQILAQVRAARRRAEEEGTGGPAVSALFRAAVRTGRRVRAETDVGSSPAAFVGAGLDAAEDALGSLHGRAAVVVGAGTMAALAASALAARGAGPTTVVNRTRARAEALAARVGGVAVGMEDLGAALAGASVALCCTGSVGAVVWPHAVGAGASVGGGSSLFLVDLAVPRDVDPAVREVPGVAVVDIDDLRGRLEALGGSAAEAKRAGEIVEEEVRAFAASRRAARLAPVIRALREAGDRAVEDQLARSAPRLASLEPSEREAVEALARAIAAKLLHSPTVRMKELEGEEGDAAVRLLIDLFDLEHPPGA